MEHLTTYKLFESKSVFVSEKEIDELLDKINKSGITSLDDIDRKRINLFSDGDKEIIETIIKMGDITNQFRTLNNKIRELSDSGDGKIAWFDKPEGKEFMKKWTELNNQLRPLEQSFRKYGIELGDPRLDKLMREVRPDAYNRDIFESIEDNQTIEEICIELNDIGLDVSITSDKVKSTNFKKINRHNIIIYKKALGIYANGLRTFHITEKNNETIRETLLRIKDFLGNKFRYIEIHFNIGFNTGFSLTLKEDKEILHNFGEDTFRLFHIPVEKIEICYLDI